MRRTNGGLTITAKMGRHILDDDPHNIRSDDGLNVRGEQIRRANPNEQQEKPIAVTLDDLPLKHE